MRRSDREITDFNEMIAVMKKCDVCRVAFNDGDFPYVIPLNFGMTVEGNKVTLYFHGAMEGKKYDVMTKDPHTTFEMDCDHVLAPDVEKRVCSMAYESVIGQGMMKILPEEENMKALRIMMEQYGNPDFPINEAVAKRTKIFCMEVEQMWAKRRPVPNMK